MATPVHRSVSNVRPSVPSQAVGVVSPHTPNRAISSNFGSPSSLRAEEDCIIVDIGSRYLRVGFAGDAVPKAVMGFGPEEQRRAGDFRKWQTGYDAEWRTRLVGKDYGSMHELWKLDLRDADLGLIGDKIERAMREALVKYLLIDSRPRRMVLILPPAIPVPLLSTALNTLFNNFNPPTVSLMSAPVLATVAAGLRAGLIVDIGWAETIVTGVYEFREVACRRSVRAGKLLGLEMLKVLGQAVQSSLLKDGGSSKIQDEESYQDAISFNECEEVLTRMAWCKPLETSGRSEKVQRLSSIQDNEDLETAVQNVNLSGKPASLVSIPLNSTKPPVTIELPFWKLAEPCEKAFFAGGIKSHEYHSSDDEELPLHQLIYRSLVQLPVDIRSVCMARIIFTGGGSKLPGLKSRLMGELQRSIGSHGWDPVFGKAVREFKMNEKLRWNREKPRSPRLEDLTDPKVKHSDIDLDGGTILRGAAHEAIKPDPIADQVLREATKGTYPTVHGSLRAVESMGAWSGASLMSQLKIPAVSVIDREQWLLHGISGASRQGEVVLSAKQRQSSLGSVGLRGASAELTGWTLGPWG